MYHIHISQSIMTLGNINDMQNGIFSNIIGVILTRLKLSSKWKQGICHSDKTSVQRVRNHPRSWIGIPIWKRASVDPLTNICVLVQIKWTSHFTAKHINELKVKIKTEINKGKRLLTLGRRENAAKSNMFWEISTIPLYFYISSQCRIN